MIIVSKKSLNENLHISHQLRLRKMFYDNSNRHLPFEKHKRYVCSPAIKRYYKTYAKIAIQIFRMKDPS